MSTVHNQLTATRKARGIRAAELARRVGVSRQTIYAIEAGTYVPNTEVALKLARELGARVEDLFVLPADQEAQDLSAEFLGQEMPQPGQPVRLAQVGSRWISVPVTAAPTYLPEADAFVKPGGRSRGKAHLELINPVHPDPRQLVIAGCDPAISYLGRMIEQAGGELVSTMASSRLALQWLKENKVHVAGTHLEDPKTGEYNLPFVRRQFPGENMLIVTYAHWEEGLVVPLGNPKSIRTIADLARRGVRIVNREPGSGSRALLDRLLREARIPLAQVSGHEWQVAGHLAAAQIVASGAADCCLATRSAARAFRLDFLPLRSERYDLVLRHDAQQLPAVQALLDSLQRAALRRKLESLAGYDTAQTGTLVHGAGER